jgi:hypothetical protein
MKPGELIVVMVWWLLGESDRDWVFSELMNS